MRQHVVFLHAAAPPKPPAGQPCNGCGVCCAYAPCPLGILLSRRRTGACSALQWNPAEVRYRCGPLADPARFLPWLPGHWARALVRRWIAAARGCDASVDSAPVGEPGHP